MSLGVGIGFTVDANSASSSASSLRAQAVRQVGTNGCATDPSASVYVALRDENDHAARSRTLSTIGFVGAGVFAAGTLAAWFFWHPARPQSASALAPAFELYPALGAAPGIIARGRF